MTAGTLPIKGTSRLSTLRVPPIRQGPAPPEAMNRSLPAGLRVLPELAYVAVAPDRGSPAVLAATDID